MNEVHPHHVILTNGNALKQRRKEFYIGLNKNPSTGKSKTPSGTGRARLAMDTSISAATIGRLEKGTQVSWVMWQSIAQHLDLDPYSACGVQAFDDEGQPLELAKIHEGKSPKCIWVNKSSGKNSELSTKLEIKIPTRKLALPDKRNPLMYYGVDDSDDFAGREEETEEAVRRIEQGFIRSEREPVVCISGDSGCGKSSFLRAGLLARLRTPIEELQIHSIVFRPTDFIDHDNKPQQIATDILCFVADQTDLKIDQKLQAQVTRGPRRQAPAMTIEAIEKSLSEAGKNHYMVIGIDQFEEILNRINDDQTAESWLPILRIIEQCCHSEHIGLAYTMETTRNEMLKETKLPASFYDHVPIILDGLSERFVKRVMQHPFRMAGYELGDEVLDAIVTNVRELQSDNRSDSLLPLLRLKRDRWIELLSNNSKFNKQPSVPSLAESFDRNLEVTLEDINNDTEIRNEIAHLGEAAIFESGISNPRIETNLYPSLHSLVSLSGVDSKDLVLNAAHPPSYSTQRKLFLSLVRYKLIVPAAKDRFRLVHEAVIRYWPRADSWLEKTRPLLSKEIEFRERATRWASDGKTTPPVLIQSNRIADINTAADILYAHWTAWTINEDNLRQKDKDLRDYCLAVFNQSDEPRERTGSQEKDGTHMNLAAGYGQDTLVRKFLNKDASLTNLRSKQGKFPLYVAAWNHSETVKILLEAGADPADKDSDGFTAISTALAAGNIEAFEILLSYCSKTDLDSKSHGFPLHTCASLGQSESIHYVLTKEIWSANEKNEAGHLPIHLAASNGCVEALRTLSSHTEDLVCSTDGTELNILHLAAQGNHCDCVRTILEEFEQFETLLEHSSGTGLTALGIACQRLNAECVEVLLSFGADPNNAAFVNINSEKLPIHLAIEQAGSTSNLALENKLIDTVRTILTDSRTDPNRIDRNGDTPLGLAVRKSADPIVSQLLNHPKLDPLAPISRGERCALQLCAEQEERWSIIAQMLDRDQFSPTSSIDNDNNTPLHILSRYSIPIDLLSRIANAKAVKVNAVNNQGWTPLMNAMDSGKTSTIKFFLTLDSIEPTTSGETTATPLGLAFGRLRPKSQWKCLLTRDDSAIKGTDKYGFTPLHIAVLKRSDELKNWVKEHASSMDQLWEIRDQRERTPRALTNRRAKHIEVVGASKIVNFKPQAWDSKLDWKEIGKKKRGALSSQLISAFGFRIEERWKVRSCPLPYYTSRRVTLVKVVFDERSTHPPLYFVSYCGITNWILDGESYPIHYANQPQFRITAEASEQKDSVSKTLPHEGNKSTTLAVQDVRNKNKIIELPVEGLSPTKPGHKYLELLELLGSVVNRKNHPLLPLTRSQLEELFDELPSELREGTTIKLNESNVIDYLRFFCFFVRGSEGPFLLLEHPEQTEVVESETTEMAKAAIARFAAPATLEGYDRSRKAFLVSAVLWYGDGIYFADFAVMKSGFVAMEADLPLQEGISSRSSTGIATEDLVQEIIKKQQTTDSAQ